MTNRLIATVQGLKGLIFDTDTEDSDTVEPAPESPAPPNPFDSDLSDLSQSPSEEFNNVFKQLTALPQSGSLGETLKDHSKQSVFELPKKFTRSVFTDGELPLLSQLYSGMSPDCSTATMHINSVFQKYASITINGKRYTSTVNHTNPTFYLAKWEESVLGGLPDDSNCVSTIVYDRPLIIHYIAVHHCSDLEQSYKYTVACVSWDRLENIEMSSSLESLFSHGITIILFLVALTHSSLLSCYMTFVFIQQKIPMMANYCFFYLVTNFFSVYISYSCIIMNKFIVKFPVN